jgi:hypothetical protein
MRQEAETRKSGEHLSYHIHIIVSIMETTCFSIVLRAKILIF